MAVEQVVYQQGPFDGELGQQDISNVIVTVENAEVGKHRYTNTGRTNYAGLPVYFWAGPAYLFDQYPPVGPEQDTP